MAASRPKTQMSKSSQLSDSLKSGHRKAIGFDKPPIETYVAPKKPTEVILERYFDAKSVELLKNIHVNVVKKAWFTMAHALLDPKSVVLDAGCRDGEVTYAMAALYPHLYFVGLDVNAAAIERANATYSLPNLRFEVGNIYTDLPENGYDLIVNSFFLHEVYSASFYNDKLIQLALERQYKALKPNGIFLVRDYINPAPGEYVLMEFTDKAASGDTFETLSEAELLVWFSEHARAKSLADDQSFASGFFLEELPANYPRTRLFRVPSKWANEFILRKDNRELLREELSKEYAFYTETEFRKVLRGFGARITYTAPHWDEGFIKARYTGAIRLYKEDGTKIGPPPTSHVIVAQKVMNNTSQVLMERRTSRAKTGSVYLRTVRDDRSGAMVDLVCRDMEIAELIPFRLTPDNVLKIYLHENVPRGLVNSVPRTGNNLDGKRWSGHMTEAIGVNGTEIQDYKNAPNSELQKYMAQHIGIRPSVDAKLLEGGGFYPDPNQIDERVLTYYIRTEDYYAPFPVKETMKDIEGFSDKGRVREFDAQEIMNAIAVGLVPSSRLEVQILALYQLLGLKARTWRDMPIQLSEISVEEVAKINELMKQYALSDDRFKATRGNAGTVRVVQSVFVDEGRDQGGGMAGLAAKDVEFTVPENATMNTAVVLPLVKNLNGEVMAGIVTQHLPVPQRYTGTGYTMTLPSFPLPKDVNDMEAARHYIAEQFKVKLEHVSRMGESYFTHIGLTPHRIYPFAVTDSRGFYDGQTHGTTQLTMLRDLWKMLYWDNHDSFLKVAAIALQHLTDSNDLSLGHDFSSKMSDVAQKSVIGESNVVGYQAASPSASPAPAAVQNTNEESTGQNFVAQRAPR
jgi:SAM-dependent methyltransferase